MNSTTKKLKGFYVQCSCPAVTTAYQLQYVLGRKVSFKLCQTCRDATLSEQSPT